MRDNSRIRAVNGELSLAIAVPLTTTSNSKPLPDPGWMQMASALLAVDHFNTKNGVVVSQLEDEELLRDCPLKLVNVSVIDTGTNSHQAMKTLLQTTVQKAAGKEGAGSGIVDAIAGPYNEQPALELSVLATGLESPMVAFRGLDQNLILPNKHPYYSQINPDLNGEMEFLGNFLKHTNRTEYIAILYTNDDSALQRMETLQQVLKEKLNCEQVKAYSYLSVAKTTSSVEDRGIRQAVERVARTGFRTIVVITTTPDIDTPGVGFAAMEFGLDQGNHFWIIPGGLDPTGSNRDNILVEYKDKPEGRWLRGAAFTYLFEGHNVNPNDPFVIEMASQNATFVQRLKQLNPVTNYKGKHFCHNLTQEGFRDALYNPQCEPSDDLFERLPYLAERVGFAYDATMAIGIGACLAIANKTSTTATTRTTAMTGLEHLHGIQSVDFAGASGQVRFQNQPGTPGSRDSTSTIYGIINLLPPGGDILEATSFLDPRTREWVEVTDYVYADGTTSPPMPLRTVPEQNYLDPGVRAVGLTLMSIALVCICASALWVFMNRNHRVVIAAQPPFLYVLCLGSTLTVSVILVSSFDESYGWTDDMLDKACVAMPWLVLLGDMVTYSALFTKLWRVNKVLQFKRARIQVQQVVWPALFVIVISIAILAVWTGLGDFGWVREEIDNITGESIGRCTGCHSMAFLVPVTVLCCVPTIITCVMAWKTSDVDDMYSESKWIFSLVLVQMQVMIVGVPVIAILQTVSTNGRYIGLCLLAWTFPMSTMGLIMVPKMMAVRQERLNSHQSSSQPKRGSSQGIIQVSGIKAGESPSHGRLSTNTGRSSTSSNPDTNNNATSFTLPPGPRVQTVTFD